MDKYEQANFRFDPTEEILKKVLMQSQLTAVISSIEEDKNLKDLLQQHYVFVETTWERMFQETRRNNVLEANMIRLTHQIKKLKEEVEFLKD